MKKHKKNGETVTEPMQDETALPPEQDKAVPAKPEVPAGPTPVQIAVKALAEAVAGQKASEAEWKTKVAAARNAVRKTSREQRA